MSHELGDDRTTFHNDKLKTVEFNDSWLEISIQKVFSNVHDENTSYYHWYADFVFLCLETFLADNSHDLWQYLETWIKVHYNFD